MSLPYLHNQKLLHTVAASIHYKDNENFGEWQKKGREKLELLLGLPYKSCELDFHILSEKNCGSHREIYFQFQSEPGYYVPCCFCVPLLEPQNSPVVICLQGHSTGMHISLGQTKYPNDSNSLGGDRDFALQAVKKGYCAVTVEQRCFGECGGNSKGPDCTRSSLTALLIGRITIGERVWDIKRLIDLLQTGIFPQIDIRKICCLGNSGGGTSAFYTSCIDPRIQVSIPSCSVCTYESSIASVYHCPCNYIPNICLYFDMGDLAGLIAPRPLVIVAGKQDEIFPEHGVRKAFEEAQRLYTACGVPQNCQLIFGPEGHRFYADISWPVIKKYLEQEE